jgi:hypothetical protein
MRTTGMYCTTCLSGAFNREGRRKTILKHGKLSYFANGHNTFTDNICHTIQLKANSYVKKETIRH